MTNIDKIVTNLAMNSNICNSFDAPSLPFVTASETSCDININRAVCKPDNTISNNPSRAHIDAAMDSAIHAIKSATSTINIVNAALNRIDELYAPIENYYKYINFLKYFFL